jgi:DMSO/TMAO reductase YedYZ molybdopterin-dependent catalytic subunit
VKLALPQVPPPAPSRPGFWRSPLRSTWTTTILGSALLGALVIVAVTGFLSHAAYQPDLGRNALVPRGRDLQLFVIGWPTSPSWLYAFTQGLHVTVGTAAVPILLAKLWSVVPKLFTWPPVRSPAHALERLSIALLVGSAIFEFATGIANAQLYYPWRFDFVVAHYYGAWVLSASVLLHVAIKLPKMRAALAARRALAPMVDDELRSPDPAPVTLTRRGMLATLGAAGGLLAVTTGGQALGGPFRGLALFAPRGTGAGGFPVNKTARTSRITPAMVGAAWQLRLGDELALTRDELLAMSQHTYDLAIACVEGWSTTQRWTGVRLRDLAARAGASGAATVQVVSLQPRGAFRQTTLGPGQLRDERALLALKVNGEDLPLDHGYPARIIVPALPGVHCTKWVGELRFA